jgi:hypothetical protein
MSQLGSLAHALQTAAKLALAEARRLSPKLTIRWFAEHLNQPAPFLVDWWRKAGMPEE